MSGDRYIIRDAQARHTIGGGVVLDPNAPQRKRRSPARLAWLDAISELHAGGTVLSLLQQAPWGLDEPHAMRLMSRTLDDLTLPEGALWVSARGAQAPRVLILRSQWSVLTAQVLQTMQSFHQNWPDEPGVNAARLRRMALPTAPDALWEALCDELIATATLSRNGPWLHIPGHAVTLTAQETELAERLLPLIHEGEFNPPWTRDLASQLNESEDLVRHVLLKLLRGELYQIVRDLFYHREQVIRLAGQIESLSGTEGVSASEFRDCIGLGRKRSIQILEFFNRSGYTRRLRDRHVVRKGGADIWQRLS